MPKIPKADSIRQLEPRTRAFLATFEALTGKRVPFVNDGRELEPVDCRNSDEPAWVRQITPGQSQPPPAAASKPGHKRSRGEELRRRRERAAQRESRILRKLEHGIRAREGHAVGVRVVKSWIWTMCSHILADASGRAGRIYLRRCPNKPFVGAVLRAAFGELDEDGNPAGRYAWCDERARCIVAAGLALVALSKRTKRAGPWNACVIGIPRGAFQALLADPYDMREHKRTPASTTLFGRHRPEGTAANGQVGYFVALAECGAFYRQQLPKGQGHLSETCYPSGYPPNRYWLVAPEPERQNEDEHRDRLYELARLVHAHPVLRLERPPPPTDPPPDDGWAPF